MEAKNPIIHLDYWELIPRSESHEDMVIFRRLVQVIYYCSIIHHELELRKKYTIRLRGIAYTNGTRCDWYYSDRIVYISNPNPLRQVGMRTPLSKARHIYATTANGTTHRLYFHQKLERYSELLALSAHNPPRTRELYRYFTSID